MHHEDEIRKHLFMVFIIGSNILKVTVRDEVCTTYKVL